MASEPVFEPVAPSVAGYDWSGIFIGAHGGWAGTDTSGQYDIGGDADNLGDFDLNGALVGGQLGYNFQTGMYVLGVEGDVSGLLGEDMLTTVEGYNLGAETEYLASIRGRLGVALGNWLLFGTAGYAYADQKFCTTNSPADFGPNGCISLDNGGLVFGGGIEHA